MSCFRSSRILWNSVSSLSPACNFRSWSATDTHSRARISSTVRLEFVMKPRKKADKFIPRLCARRSSTCLCCSVRRVLTVTLIAGSFLSKTEDWIVSHAYAQGSQIRSSKCYRLNKVEGEGGLIKLQGGTRTKNSCTETKLLLELTSNVNAPKYRLERWPASTRVSG